MITPRSARRKPVLAALLSFVMLAMIGATAAASPAAQAPEYARISGTGSSWAGNAVHQWIADVKARNDLTVDYTPDGSSAGRRNFADGLSDFAVTDIAFTGETADPQDNEQPDFDYGLLPAVAGGTAFMYNLPLDGNRFERLQLSQSALAKIFSGQVTAWNDPVIAATNPDVDLPAQEITVVVRSDGSGTTAQFTLWMLRQFPNDWTALCARTGCNPAAATSYFPYQGLSNFTAQSGSKGVTTYTANTPYTINYDEYSYALGVGFPVAGLQNEAGYFTTPTDTAVAVALTQARINGDQDSPNYLSQDLRGVYAYADPRTYPISAYSYLAVPAETHGTFDKAKGATLASFANYAVCQGQQAVGALGYAPLPMNLVLAAQQQLLLIPGIDAATRSLIARTAKVRTGGADPCHNPTFQPGDDPAHNVLIDTAPFPDGCDAACQAPWVSDQLLSVTARLETPGVYDDDLGGDADADDPAIWVNRAEPGRSRVIATLKNAGLAVYNLRGRVVQRIAAPPAPGPDDESGRFNNVDIVRDVVVDGREVDLAVTSDRGRDEIRSYTIDATDGHLTDVTAADVPFAFSTDQAEVNEQTTIYGLDVYKARNGETYVIGTRRHTTEIAMFRLVVTPAGVTYRKIDDLVFPDTYRLPDGTSWSPCEDPGEGPQLEGLVVGPSRLRLFAAQEDVGLWRVRIGNGGFRSGPVNIERTQDYGVPATYDEDTEECVQTGADPGFGGRIAADVEGLAIYNEPHPERTLLVSSQGDDTFYTYDRRTLEALNHFEVASGPNTDGSQDSDGADTTSTPLPGYPNGLLVVQDGNNTPDVIGDDGEARPNTDFKFLDAGILTQR